ncbi:MAG: serine protease [Proteobacteria bacterium]|nr:serine protease [Pseudomonadota bacterium]
MVVEPNAPDVSIDVGRILPSIVSVRTIIPDDAYTASILGTERMGHGVVIGENGLILTIGYLVMEAESVWVIDHEGRPAAAHVLANDQETGFGLVQTLTPLRLPAVGLGDSNSAAQGDSVVIVGYGNASDAVQARIISRREFAGYWEYLVDNAIFTEPTYADWSGAALFGRGGELLGICSLFIQRGDGDADSDQNMFVPIDLLKPILDELTAQGEMSRPSRPWLGMFTMEAEQRLAIAGLVDDGPANKAGVKVGDFVLAVGGVPVADLADMYRRIWAVGRAGADVPLSIARDGHTFDVVVHSGDRSDRLKAPALH